MKTKKMSLANIQGKLSRAEMKNIMAGSGGMSCQCTDGTSAGMSDCSHCDSYCANHGGQSNTSDCCTG